MNGKTKASNRVIGVQPSATIVVADRARALEQEGFDVINLGGGDPDFDTPSHIVDAGLKAIRDGHTHYGASRGLKPLRSAISDKLRDENDLEFDPDTEIIVTPGAKLGLYAAIMAIVDHGDEVLIPDPFWVSYEECVKLADGVPVRVPLRREENFCITSSVLREKLTSRSKLVLLNSPHNPTGRVLRDEELEAVAEIALGHDLLVLSDEIYEKILYDDHRHVSIGSMQGMLERSIIVNGFSKSYAMTGWRLGYVAAREALTKQILKVHQHSVTCASPFTQYAGLAALQGSQEPIRQMVDVYAERREIIADGLNGLPGVTCPRPEGAFYAFPDVSGTGMSSTEFTEKILDDAKVAFTPGVAFGTSGEGHVRLSFANSTELIEKAIERMREAL